jgi:hypothetical protein
MLAGHCFDATRATAWIAALAWLEHPPGVWPLSGWCLL